MARIDGTRELHLQGGDIPSVGLDRYVAGFSLSFKVDSKDVRDVETFKLKM